MALHQTLGHYQILSSMLAPAFLMAATGSLLASANNRLARVVDRLRVLVAAWHSNSEQRPVGLDAQIARHRRRSRYVLHACVMLYCAVGAFVGTSLALAADAFTGFKMPVMPTILAVIGVLCLLVASIYLGLEVVLAVHSFDEEIDLEIERRTS